jgi:hypothetical protein
MSDPFIFHRPPGGGFDNLPHKDIKGPPPGGGFVDVHQEIVDATIAPEAGAINISFKTLRPAKPIYTVWKDLTHQEDDMVPQNQIVAAFESLTPTTTHMKRITGLPQGELMWLRIDAAAEDVPVGDPRQPASFVCQTGTCVRSCAIKIASLELLNSGDPGGGASMVFLFQVYNGDSKEHEGLTAGRRVEIDSIDNGLKVGEMEGTFNIDNAPDVVVPSLGSVHVDGFPMMGTGLPPSLVGDVPNGPEVSSDAGGDSQASSCVTPVTLPVAPGDTTSTLLMGTALNVPSFTATLTIETNVKNSKGIAVVTK